MGLQKVKEKVKPESPQEKEREIAKEDIKSILTYISRTHNTVKRMKVKVTEITKEKGVKEVKGEVYFELTENNGLSLDFNPLGFPNLQKWIVITKDKQIAIFRTKDTKFEVELNLGEKNE